MCGAHSARELQATGVLNAMRKSGWVGIADELAELSDDDFDNLIVAFKIFREERQSRKQREHGSLPTRKAAQDGGTRLKKKG